jgi:hypothetical protein
MERPISLVRRDLIVDIVADAARLTSPGVQIDEVLAGAPKLENWSVGRPTAYGLRGEVTGDPKLGDGLIDTSAAYMLASEFSWVRTMFRFYRLGAPSSETIECIEAARVRSANNG